MTEQQEFAKLLYKQGLGIALRRPTQEIDVGDVCYWDSDGTAVRILNVFDNADVWASNSPRSRFVEQD